MQTSQVIRDDAKDDEGEEEIEGRAIHGTCRHEAPPGQMTRKWLGLMSVPRLQRPSRTEMIQPAMSASLKSGIVTTLSGPGPFVLPPDGQLLFGADRTAISHARGVMYPAGLAVCGRIYIQHCSSTALHGMS